jgi:hypothetical protein
MENTLIFKKYMYYAKAVTLLTLLINTLLAVMYASFISMMIKIPFIKILITAETITHTISLPILVSCYTVFLLTREKTFIRSIPYMILGGAVGIFIGTSILPYLLQLLRFSELYQFLINAMGKIRVIAFIITSIFIVIYSYYVRLRIKSYKDVLKQKMQTNGETENKTLAFKEKGENRTLYLKDIIYLSSHGRNTLIHTEARDYQVSKLLKEMEEMLDEGQFMRIHKQFVLNTAFISEIKYYKGSNYQTVLNDSDDTCLPVSRKLAPLLKKNFNL